MAFGKNVFILGAGFSAPAGIPVMRHFMTKARELYEDPDGPLSDNEKQRFEKVFSRATELSKTQASVSTDLEHLENIFSLIDMDTEYGSAEGRRIGTLRSEFVYLLLRTIECTSLDSYPTDVRPDQVGKPSHSISALNFHPKSAAYKGLPGYLHQPNDTKYYWLYDYFAFLASKGAGESPIRDTFITFNYDLLMDKAIYNIDGIAPSYCLEYDQARFENMQKDGKTLLLKLHGSTNWLYCYKCHALSVFNKTLPFVPNSAKHLETFGNSYLNRYYLQCSKCQETGKISPVVVPPTWNKSDFRELMRPVWRRALKELSEARRICVIGFSMPETDLFFRHLISLALESKPPYGLRVIGGGRGLEERYRQFLNQNFADRHFSFIPGRIEELWFNPSGREEMETWLERPVSAER